MSEVARDLSWVCRQSGGKRQKQIGRTGEAESDREREREGQGGSVCVRMKVQVGVRMGRAVRVAKEKTHGCNVRSSHPQGTRKGRKNENKK